MVMYHQVGGDRGTVDSIQPLLSAMGKNIRYMGPAGSGQHTKMVGEAHTHDDAREDWKRNAQLAQALSCCGGWWRVWAPGRRTRS